MIANLTVGERQSALVVLFIGGLVGLAMAVAGAGDAFGVHGFLVLGFCALLFFPVLSKLDEPEPSPDVYDEYYDDPIKVGIILSMIWALVGMFFGLWVAYLLAWPGRT